MLDKKAIDSFDEFVEQFIGESDRSAVVLSAAKLDQQLYFLLSRYLLKSYNKQQDELLDGDSPLASFSARINLCYRVGLIDKSFADALHIVRKIRNDFAHKVTARLTDSPYRDRMRNLVNIVGESQLFSDVKDVYGLTENHLKSEYFVAIIVLAIQLEAKVNLTIALTPEKPLSVLSTNN